ncbi:Transcriptional regulator [Sulfitobacter noctilucicola]|uniref:Transcriptional regulator n=1 Tax=Sulfitobacter noctilucicola TaxID=1342301 RepID=A0A7W6Q4F4_9RHOB|nr:FMN-binding negative transcriptional regulator [Sulfitobacter noctilucicola]KIN62614.1 Transcriptional regulator [Sulfitobacter noctilucicola]MBB4172852.1 transcriptional regulator [Sulfitobacter noctilucicola]
MHPNPVFHDADAARNMGFARDRGFGTLAINAEDGPLMSHIPFLLNAEGTVAELHLVRSNPIVRALKRPVAARIAIQGPDSYISPDWYGVADQVPTWNYVAVRLTGSLELRPQEELHDLLDRQSAMFENRLAPKAPWKTAKMSEGVMDRMMRMIVPCRMQVTGIDGTWKLGQNKPEDVRKSAAENVTAHGIGAEVDVLAALMMGARSTG